MNVPLVSTINAPLLEPTKLIVACVNMSVPGDIDDQAVGDDNGHRRGVNLGGRGIVPTPAQHHSGRPPAAAATGRSPTWWPEGSRRCLRRP